MGHPHPILSVGIVHTPGAQVFKHLPQLGGIGFLYQLEENLEIGIGRDDGIVGGLAVVGTEG